MKKIIVVIFVASAIGLLAYFIHRHNAANCYDQETPTERVVAPSAPATEATPPMLARGRKIRLLTPGKDYIVVNGDHVRSSGQEIERAIIEEPVREVIAQ